MPQRTIAGDLPAPMLAKVQPDMPLGEGWTYEPKWDGFRTIVALDAEGHAKLASRDGRPLGRYFPELIELFEGEPARGPFVADAEIVRVAPVAWTSTNCSSGCTPPIARAQARGGTSPPR